jgi:hypothetical protein
LNMDWQKITAKNASISYLFIYKKLSQMKSMVVTC